MPPKRPDLPPPPGTRSFEDIAFGSHERQAIDVHLPPSGKINGVVANIHGGSWQWLDRKVIACWDLLDHGFAIVGMGYRMSDHAVFPAQICDINAGLAKLVQIAPDLDLPMDRVAVMGLSAGGIWRHWPGSPVTNRGSGRRMASTSRGSLTSMGPPT